MSVYLDKKLLYPHLKVNWNVLMCKICIALRLVVDIFPMMQCEFCAFPKWDAGGVPNGKRVSWASNVT